MRTPIADTQDRRRGVGRWQQRLRDAARYVPQGDSIPSGSWQARHRNILVFLVVYVLLLYFLGNFTGSEPYVTGATFTAVPAEHVSFGAGAVVGLALSAWLSWLPRRIWSSPTSTRLLTCSALLIYFSGGYIEAHFHFFVIVVVLTVYEDWLSFAVGIPYVVIQHGVFGMDHPGAVYNHPDAIANPMDWGLVHAALIPMLAPALVTNWFSVECSREETRQKMQSLEDSEEAKAEVERLNEQLVVRADELAAAMDVILEGDFTANPPEGPDIEVIEAISDAFTATKRDLSSTIVDLRAFAATVERTTQLVHGDVKTFERTQRQLAADVGAFATDVREQAHDLESTTGELNSLLATIEEIATSADQTFGEASDAAEAAEAGTGTATTAIEAIKNVEQSVDELASLVELLDDRMDDVSKSTGLIESIVEQTNTLALNANIEAVRTPNGNEGFVVVANEMKSLADETQSHSTTIERAITETIEDAARVQTEMKRVKAQLGTGRPTMTGAAEASVAVSDIVESADMSVDEVAMATGDGAHTTEEVVGAIIGIADHSRDIAEQSGALASQVESRAAAISGVREQFDDLRGQTGSLQARLKTFDCEAPVDD